jgi:hypothetical protein
MNLCLFNSYKLFMLVNRNIGTFSKIKLFEIIFILLFVKLNHNLYLHIHFLFFNLI